MSLKERITEDMKAAMRAKDTERLGTIRLLLAAMKQKEVDERVELDDVAVIGIVDKMIKQRKDRIDAFEQGRPHGPGGQGEGGSRGAAGLPAAAAVGRRGRGRGQGDRGRARAPRAPATWARSWAPSRPGWPARPTWGRFPRR